MKLRSVLGMTVSALLTISLASCGGGGGGSSAPPAGTTFTVGGTVSGLTTAQTVTLKNGTDTLNVTANGSFTFATAVVTGGTYSVTVGTQPTALGCRVAGASGAVGAANVVSVTVSCRAEIAYVANMDNGTISQYTVSQDGSLTPMSTPTINAGLTATPTPKSIAIDPTGSYAYVANYGDGTVAQFTIGAGGLLAPMTPPTVTIGSGAPTPGNPTGSAPNSVVIDPTGHYVYVVAAGDSTVSQFTLNATGGLVPMSPATVPTGGGPLLITLTPNGKFAYVSNFFDPGSTVSQYSVGSSGALSPLSAPTVMIGAGRQPFGVTVDPTGTYAYIEDFGEYTATQTAGALLQFTIGADGSLTLTPGSTPVALGMGPFPLVINSTDQYGFLANTTDSTLFQCNIGTGGTITCAHSSGVVGALPRASLIDPSGRYLYVTDQGDGDVRQFAISAGPTLTPIEVGYVAAGVSPTFIAMTR